MNKHHRSILDTTVKDMIYGLADLILLAFKFGMVAAVIIAIVVFAKGFLDETGITDTYTETMSKVFEPGTTYTFTLTGDIPSQLKSVTMLSGSPDCLFNGEERAELSLSGETKVKVTGECKADPELEYLLDSAAWIHGVDLPGWISEWTVGR